MKRELKVFEEEERSFLRAEKKLKKLRNPYSFLYQIKELVKKRGKNLE
mgnify:CR=1 FL=1